MKKIKKSCFMLVLLCLLLFLPGQAAQAANAHNYYGSQLNGAAKAIYDKLMAANWNKSDTVTFKLPASYTWSSDEDVQEETVEPAIEAFYLDQYKYYEIRTLLASYSYGTIDGVQSATTFSYERLDYLTGMTSQRSQVSSALSKAYQAIDAQRKSSSRYDTLKAIHDYVAELVSYCYGEPQQQTLNGALLSKYKNQASCEGYSKLFRTICLHYNIPCVVVIGYASSYRTSASDPVYSSNHMWNLVKMENGKWYMVDVTWDDQATIEYTYFLAGSSSEGFRSKVGIDHVAGQTGSKLKAPTLASSGYKAENSTGLSAPAKVGTLKVKNIKTTSAAVSFSAVSGADGYQAYVSASSSFTSGVKKFKASSNRISLTGLKSGKTYYVKVRAYKKVSGKTVWGKFSSVKKITLKTSSTLQLSATKMTLTVGGSVTLKVTGTADSVQWSSSKPSVATVKNGEVTAKKAGTAKIIATVSGKTFVCTVTVKAK